MLVLLSMGIIIMSFSNVGFEHQHISLVKVIVFNAIVNNISGNHLPATRH